MYYFVLLQSQFLVDPFVYVVGGYAWAPLVKCTHNGVLAIGHPGVLPSLLPHYTL
jgi:hypothetical protein